MLSYFKKISFIIILFSSIITQCKQIQLKKNITSVSSKNLRNHIHFLVSQKPYRNYTNIASLNQSADYIKKQIEQQKLPCEYQAFTAYGNKYKNVICKITVNKNAKTFIIGAHYDVAGEQKGADDNASGVAGLIELSKILSKNKHLLKQNIELVAFTLEEPPFFASNKMGSYIHAMSIKDNVKKYTGMISLEMIGYFSNKKNSQDYPSSIMKVMYPTKANFIAAVGNISSRSLATKFKEITEKIGKVNCETLSAPSIIPGVDFSDHRNYWTIGLKAIMITDTAFFRNKAYHTINDTQDKLNFKSMAYVIDATAQFVFNLE